MRRMTIRRAAPQFVSRSILVILAIFCVQALLLSAQTISAPLASAPGISTPPSVHGVLNLEDAWRFHRGDDPRWADPSFDDSDWQAISLSQPLTSQGI